MELISTAQICTSLQKVRPSHIAVAYVGLDWKDYIDASELQEIIVSPTVGSNPWAIQQIASHIGWDRLHFLSHLHTKLYIGVGSAAFGSFNLSKNGISADGLEEFGAITRDAQHLCSMHEEFSRLRKAAIAQFPSAKIKEDALQRLFRETRVLDRTGITKRNAESSWSLRNYPLLTDHDFYIAWYRKYVPPINVDKVTDHAPALSIEALLSGQVLYGTFLEKDDIRPADWILLWQARDNGEPDRRVRPLWLNVGDVISRGVDEAPYSKLVVEYRGSERHAPPFSLDDAKTINAIYSALSSHELSPLRPNANSNDDWALSNSRQQLHRFLELAREHLSE